MQKKKAASKKTFSKKKSEEIAEEIECEREEIPREGGEPIIIRRGNRAERIRKEKAEAINELKKQYWHEDSRAVDMVLTPTSSSPEEVIKLINEALEFAYNHCQK